MKEYKIFSQKGSILRNTDSDFEDELNKMAREGWRVITSMTIDMRTFKVILERDKNR